MTGSPAWHVRVEHEDAVTASGFLVSPGSVLTCAHVVHGIDHAMVSFPGAPGLAPVPARVTARGGWAGGPTDPGDVAVLSLDRPVRVAPAVFAVLEQPLDRPPPRLVSYGFPEGYADEGVQSELRPTSHQLIMNEWNQLEFWKGYGQEPSHGFSGSAAMLADSGAVVGMVSSYDPVGRSGRMIPSQVIARHLPALADLVPTPGYPAEEKRWLRELVSRIGATSSSVDRLLRAAAGTLGVDPPADSPAGLWQGVWYLLTETRPEPGRLPLAELTVRLADMTADLDLRHELRSWSREHRARNAHADAPVAAPPRRADPPAPLPWAPILVELRRSGADRHLVNAEVSAYRDGSRLLVGAGRFGTGDVRPWVLDRIDEAFDELDGGRPLIAFSLPRDWLNRPVEQWTRSKAKEPPLGCSVPVVVMDHERRSKGRLRFQLKRMWEELDRQEGSALHRIGCGSTHRAPQLSVLLQEVHGPVGFTRPPRTGRDRELHGAALNAPAPIVLWPRTGCPPGGPCAGACAGAVVLDQLATLISSLPPVELPELVFELRRAAFVHQGTSPHWAAELSLVWDDPRRFPEVRPLNRSPVG